MPFGALVPLSLAVVFSLVYGVFFVGQPVGLAQSVVKTAATGFLAIAAVSVGASGWLVAGLALGAVGDWFLSRHDDRAFLAGLIAFALAHLAYVFLMIWGGALGPVPHSAGGWVLVGISAGLGTILFRHAGEFRWPVLGYVLVILAMGLTALTLPHELALGLVAALLFIVSDTVLGFELFVLREGRVRRVAPYVVWITYWLAQFGFLMTFSGISFT